MGTQQPVSYPDKTQEFNKGALHKRRWDLGGTPFVPQGVPPKSVPTSVKHTLVEFVTDVR